jgi:hypothetical protein
MSHSSWFLYASMLRIYKHYDFNINDPTTLNKQMSFSSYPGKCVIPMPILNVVDKRGDAFNVSLKLFVGIF